MHVNTDTNMLKCAHNMYTHTFLHTYAEMTNWCICIHANIHAHMPIVFEDTAHTYVETTNSHSSKVTYLSPMKCFLL